MNGTVQSAYYKLVITNTHKHQAHCDKHLPIKLSNHACTHAHMHLTLSDSSFNGLSKDGEVTLVLTLMRVAL